MVGEESVREKVSEMKVHRDIWVQLFQHRQGTRLNGRNTLTPGVVDTAMREDILHDVVEGRSSGKVIGRVVGNV